MLKKITEFAIDKIRKNLTEFSDCFLSEQSENYVYKKWYGHGWTEGFWTAMIWLAYEMTGEAVFAETAMGQLDYFKKRIYEEIDIDTHDLGFLYSLSCVSAYKLTGDEMAKKAALRAAELLIGRFHEKGEFIQAWGSLNEKENYRLIIDCLLNLPLLYWASEETGDAKFADIAKRHLKTTLNCIFREDNTTHHTFYFNPETGAKVRGETHQGYSDTSCWARGQAWGVYGTALSYAYTEDESIIPYFNRATECFISRLPEDNVPYWDMIFTDGDEPRDTSAAAIAVCGILEMNKYVKNEKFMEKCTDIMNSLCENYLTDENSNGLLTDAMYSRPRNDNPECNVWGDYFFMEAIMRFNNPDWKMYW